MDTKHINENVLKAAEATEEEMALLRYLDEVASGKRWIYTESARIEGAMRSAAKLLRQKNQLIALLCADRKLWVKTSEESVQMAYKIGRQAKAKELRRAAEALQLEDA